MCKLFRHGNRWDSSAPVCHRFSVFNPRLARHFACQGALGARSGEPVRLQRLSRSTARITLVIFNKEVAGRIMRSIKLLSGGVILLCALVACTPTQPVDLAPEEAAVLSGWKNSSGQDNVSTLFLSIDGKRLEPGFFRAGLDAEYRVPAGRHLLKIQVYYWPRNHFPPNKELMNILRLSAELQAGHRYQARAEVDPDACQAEVWLEEDGNLSLIHI